VLCKSKVINIVAVPGAIKKVVDFLAIEKIDYIFMQARKNRKI